MFKVAPALEIFNVFNANPVIPAAGGVQPAAGRWWCRPAEHVQPALGHSERPHHRPRSAGPLVES
jgi:hypothetical protein